MPKEEKAKLPDITVKTSRERKKEAIAETYYERLQNGQVINSENAIVSLKRRYEPLLRKADKKELPKLKAQMNELIRRLSVKQGGPLDKKAMISVG